MLCLAGARGGEAAVIISEIMHNPQGTDLDTSATPDIYREWVELYNTGATSADLSGWSFGDSQDNNWASPFPAGTVLAPNQALVVTGNSAVFDANWGAGINRIHVSDFPTLANTPTPTNETAAIRNSLNVVQDQVNFDSANGWPAIPGERAYAGRDGHSIFLMPSGLSAAGNDVGANWQISNQGVYGGRWVNGGGQGENHGSPGIVATQQQAPFAPSPDAVWSMVVLPDTQNYNKNSIDYPVLTQMTNWIKDNKQAFNFQLVMQEGDIVNQNQNTQLNPTAGTDQTADQQWANARQAMSVLDGVVPYIMSAGNHDLGTTSAQNRDTQLNDYFQASQNPLVDDGQGGGILEGYKDPGKLENAYFELQAPDGRNLLIFSLEFWPRQAVVDWAERTARQSRYDNYSAVLLTHSYLGANGMRADADPDDYGVGGDSNDGEQLWHELVKKNGNFEMTFSGHVGGDGVAYLASVGEEGNLVHQMLINSQFELQGGNGWMRILEFLDDGRTVRVRTYSPFLDLYRTDAANSYEIALSQLPMTPGDFNADDAVDWADLNIWVSGLGTTSGGTRITGDADADGDVDGNDFLVWQGNYGAAPSLPPSLVVPEPTFSVVCLAVIALGFRRGHLRSRRSSPPS